MQSIGYYKVKQSNIQHHLEIYYEFRPLQALCEEFYKLTNTLRREKQKSTDPYLWQAEDYERRNLSDRENGEICKSGDIMLHQKDKDELVEMLYKYKDVFSLRDEISMS